jgi:RND superfamily putative drug exporter
VLFGLAMDYEMFLVSAMREEYVQTGDAHDAVTQGFRASSRVVTAAAMIMTSVFIAFIPDGSSTIKPIALGLAVGVAVDAFIVRMTLVPAVMVLMGRHAWWLPRWLDRVLPEVDVEGAALHRKINYDDWAATTGPTALHARGIVLPVGGPALDVDAAPGEVTRVDVPVDVDERTLGHVLVGRTRHLGGELVVAGRLLPEQREEVNRVATLVELGRDQRDEDAVRRHLSATARVASPRRHTRREHVDRTLALVTELDDALGSTSSPALGPAVVEAAQALAQGVEVVVLTGLDDLLLTDDRDRAERLAAALADRGPAVVLLDREPHPAPAPPDPSPRTERKVTHG